MDCVESELAEGGKVREEETSPPERNLVSLRPVDEPSKARGRRLEEDVSLIDDEYCSVTAESVVLELFGLRCKN